MRDSEKDEVICEVHFRNKENDYIFELLGVERTQPTCFPVSDTRQNACVRLVDGKYVIGTCNRDVVDYRIPCRKKNDRMSWYRGPQSTTFSSVVFVHVF